MNDHMSVWRSVRMMWERMEQQQPEGYVPYVTVHFHDGTTISPDRVQRDAPWLIFSTGRSVETLRVVVARESDVVRTEIEYVPAAKGPAGFRIAEADEDLSSIVDTDNS